MKDKKDHIEPTFNLDKMPKKQVYSVPDDYFDSLPTIIQSRVVKKEHKLFFFPNWSTAIRYALPVLALVLMVTYFGVRINNNNIDVQAMLEEIPTEELVLFLAESDISTEDILSMVDLNEFDVDGMIEEEIQLLDNSEWDEILDEYPDYENEI
jgi:hypothetical protein